MGIDYMIALMIFGMMFVNGSKNCEGQALEYQQKYISAIRHAIAKLQSLEASDGTKTN